MDWSEFSVDGAEEVGEDMETVWRSRRVTMRRRSAQKGGGGGTGDVPVALCSLGPS